MTPFHKDPNAALADLNETLARVSNLLYARRLSPDTDSCAPVLPKQPLVARPHDGGGCELPHSRAASSDLSNAEMQQKSALRARDGE